MRESEFSDIVEAWARWCHQGKLMPVGSSIMSRFIENKGHITFGSGGTSAPIIDCIESDIELALMALNDRDPDAVMLFRLEHGALRMNKFDPTKPQLEKAACLGISVRTYRRRLAKCKEHVLTQLTQRKS